MVQRGDSKSGNMRDIISKKKTIVIIDSGVDQSIDVCNTSRVLHVGTTNNSEYDVSPLHDLSKPLAFFREMFYYGHS